jgi:hypothetical protein
MDHREAQEGKFTERYLLGELTSAERDQFEEHYFDCAACADDVEAGAAFIDNARAVLIAGAQAARSGIAGAPPAPDQRPGSEEPAAALPPALFSRYGVPFQAAAWAFVCLLMIVAYENIVTIPSLRAKGAGAAVAQILPTYSLLGMGARAESGPVKVPARQNFQFELEIPGGPEFTSYRVEIRDEQRQVKISLPVSSEQVKRAVRIEIPAAALSAGSYSLIALGEKSGGVTQNLLNYSVLVQ